MLAAWSLSLSESSTRSLIKPVTLLSCLHVSSKTSNGERHSVWGASIWVSVTLPPRSLMKSKNFIAWMSSSFACIRIQVAIPLRFLDSK